ncbi:MAG: ATP-binding cassette domain-containing protein [Desulfatitalea sp.]
MSAAGLMCRSLTFARPATGAVLDRIDALFACGRATLVTGRTGAGKSTLLHLLGGLLRPTSGEVWADGEPVSRWPAPHQDRWRRQVGMMFQHLHLLSDLSVLENVLLPCVPREAAWSENSARAELLLERLGLAPMRHAPPRRLSGGQRQWVALARALINRPRFLLLDEPSAFQDDDQTRRLLDLLAETAGQGSCLVVCSHDPRLRAAAGVFPVRHRLDQGRLEAAP